MLEISVRNVLLVIIGGAVGAPLRFLMTVAITNRLHQPTFPVATLLINVTGSFLLALLTWTAADRFGLSTGARILLGTGLLGAYTTYSTFSVETVLLFERNRTGTALAYIGLTALAALLAAYLGARLGRAL